MFLVACFSVAVLNVVIRRECAHFMEERINGIVDNRKRLTPSLLDRVPGCHAPASNSPLFTEYSGAVWPGSESPMTVLPEGVTREGRPENGQLQLDLSELGIGFPSGALPPVYGSR
jgi:hypothetical protein